MKYSENNVRKPCSKTSLSEVHFDLAEGEIIRDIPGYEGSYRITNYGRIWSAYKMKSYPKSQGWLTLVTDATGYKRCELYKVGKQYCMHIHRAVAFAFLLNPNKEQFVNHIDGNKLNNHLENLEWCSQLENNRHAWQTGLQTSYGETHYAAKLTEESILEIFKLKKQGYSQTEIATRFNVNRPAISKILLRKRWKHIQIPIDLLS